MAATRLPGKPLLKINDLSIISHVFKKAEEAKIGEVVVATDNQDIVQDVQNNGGNVILTSPEHSTGTDRVFEVFKNELNSEPNIIINLQGDMPNIKPEVVTDLASYMDEGKCDIGTLASAFTSQSELQDENNVKVAVKKKLLDNNFVEATDFFRVYSENYENFYHHVGIYAFTNKALIRYVSLKRSKLELERKLEQLRALENNMSIHVSYINSSPLSVDTKKDLTEVKKIMENND